MSLLLQTAAALPALVLPGLLLVQDGAAPAADAAPASGAGGGEPNMFILLLVPLAIFWFIAIFPERKARKKKEALLASLRKNDRVLLSGGLYATIAAVSDKELTVRFDEGPTRVKVLRSAVASVLSESETPEPVRER